MRKLRRLCEASSADRGGDVEKTMLLTRVERESRDFQYTVVFRAYMYIQTKTAYLYSQATAVWTERVYSRNSHTTCHGPGPSLISRTFRLSGPCRVRLSAHPRSKLMTVGWKPKFLLCTRGARPHPAPLSALAPSRGGVARFTRLHETYYRYSARTCHTPHPHTAHRRQQRSMHTHTKA